MEFKVLGPLDVVRDGASVPLGGPKQRAVLAALLLEANRVVPTGVLIERVWGDDSHERAANTLQVYVSNLRKILEPGTTATASQRLRTQAPGYVLVVADGELDLAEFERLTTEARQASADDPDRALALYRGALDLWRGEPIADLALEPIAVAAVRIAELRTAVVEDRLDAELAAGHSSDIIGELEQLIAAFPFRERLRGQLMLALYRSGRQAEALHAYRDARELLLDELGIDPGSALQDLEGAILRQDAGLDLPAPDDRGRGRSGSSRLAVTIKTDDISRPVPRDDEPTRRVSADDLGLALLVLADGSRHALGPTPSTIGRHRDNVLPIADPDISRFHAVIELVDDTFVLTDLQSTNGTHVNGAAIARHELADDDEVRVGDTFIRFRHTGA